MRNGDDTERFVSLIRRHWKVVTAVLVIAGYVASAQVRLSVVEYRSLDNQKEIDRVELFIFNRWGATALDPPPENHTAQDGRVRR